MGQFLSYILRPSPLPTLLKLPAEILLLITSQLSSSPGSLVALSLTCKTLSFLRNRDAVRLCDKSRQNLLLLLEKDLGNRFFSCPSCRQLHRFSQQWHHFHVMNYSCYVYQLQNYFVPSSSSLYLLSYVHAHLVMNRHFYGFPSGLPLESVAYATRAVNNDGEPEWQQTPSARIIDDELFLRITHSLTGRATTLRGVINRGWSVICRHRTRDRFRSMPELIEPERDGSNEVSLFQVCHDIPGSCTVCLTDYITTVERAEVDGDQVSSGPLIDNWSITITAYHQFGQCRDPEDWKFVEFPANNSLSSPRGSLKQKRDMALYPPGVIKERWESGET